MHSLIHTKHLNMMYKAHSLTFLITQQSIVGQAINQSVSQSVLAFTKATLGQKLSPFCALFTFKSYVLGVFFTSIFLETPCRSLWCSTISLTFLSFLVFMYFSIRIFLCVCVHNTRNKNHKNRFSFVCECKKIIIINKNWTRTRTRNRDWQYKIFSIPPHTRHHDTQNQPQMGFFNFNHQVCRSSLLSAQNPHEKIKTSSALALDSHKYVE